VRVPSRSLAVDAFIPGHPHIGCDNGKTAALQRFKRQYRAKRRLTVKVPAEQPLLARKNEFVVIDLRELACSRS